MLASSTAIRRRNSSGNGCRHEVAPVKLGYRICLVYNLAITGKKQPEAPHHAPAVAGAARRIEKFFSASEPLSKLAIPFTHQYTESGFDPKQLKGADRRGYWSSPKERTPQATLYSALAREIITKRASSRFVKAERGRFTLTNAV